MIRSRMGAVLAVATIAGVLVGMVPMASAGVGKAAGQVTPNATSGTVVYFNDFEQGAGSEWSDPSVDVTPVGGRHFLGQFSNGTVTLALTGLPDHGSVTVRFDLFVIQSWDGNGNVPGTGPDIWDLGIPDGPTLLHTTFSNTGSAGNRQAYPGSYPGGDFRARKGADEKNTLGYPLYGDSVYNLAYTFAHNGSSLVVAFTASDLQGIDDESWGLDNVKVIASVANLKLSPHSGPPGTEVQAAGTGFAGFEQVTLTFVDSVNGKTDLGTFTTDAKGRLGALVTIPLNSTVGAQKITAFGSGSHQKAKARFRVT